MVSCQSEVVFVSYTTVHFYIKFLGGNKAPRAAVFQQSLMKIPQMSKQTAKLLIPSSFVNHLVSS